MENKSAPNAQTDSTISIWVDPSLEADWPPGSFLITEYKSNCAWRIEKNCSDINLFHNQRLEFSLPYVKNNLQIIANYLLQHPNNSFRKNSKLDDSILELSNLASPLFFGYGSSIDIRPFLEKISNTISLKNGLDSLFRLKWFQNHSPGILLVHQKGEAKAWQLGTGNEDSGFTKTIDIENFNQLLTAVKKTKTGQYSTQTTKWSWLPFTGAFLAEPFSFKNFNAILIATRQEFLPFASEEILHYHCFAGLLGLWLEDLIEGEFSDLRLAEIMLLLERSPLPIVIRDPNDQSVFTNISFQDNESSILQWFPLGKGYRLGLGINEEWEGAGIDVLHRHKISLLGDLFNTLGHELSNPLFGLGLASDLLINSSNDIESNSLLTEMQSNIKRCQLIIQNLTKLYSENEQEGICDIRNAIKETLTLAKSELKGIKYIIEDGITDDGPLMVEARPIFIVQILFNLIINSAQAMYQTANANIKLKIHIADAEVFVDISDNGPGLPASVKETLFQPFATTKAKGHGLGLALSRNLALKAGGDLYVLDCPEGAAFRLCLRKAR